MLISIKYSLNFLILLPCIRYPSSLNKQNDFSELPDSHDCLCSYLNSNQWCSSETNLPKHPYFPCFTLHSKAASVHMKIYFEYMQMRKQASESTLQMLQPLTGIQPQTQRRTALKQNPHNLQSMAVRFSAPDSSHSLSHTAG